MLIFLVGQGVFPNCENVDRLPLFEEKNTMPRHNSVVAFNNCHFSVISLESL